MGRDDETGRISRRGLLAAGAGLALSAAAGAAQEVAGMTGDPLLDALDLTRPGLAAVRAAVDRGDVAGARTALAAYYRARTKPLWYIDPSSPPHNASKEIVAVADRACEHTFDSVGIRHAFGAKIDWSYNPTTQPGSPDAPDNEWTWQLNRHSAWVSLARAYATTGDARYGRELSLQIADWIRECPPPVGKADQAPGSRWRTIECGIRMSGTWPIIYFTMLRRPDVFPDDVLLAMVNCMREHADYLDAFPTSGNWLTMEANGEYHVGVLFPEFKNAEHWRSDAIDRLRRELDAQVYPDGVQIELSPGYHDVSLLNFVGALRLARLNDLTLPDGYQALLERMYAMNEWAMSPDRDVPPFNDSWHIDVPQTLAEGAGFFPRRTDWEWIASDGKKGRRPQPVARSASPDAMQSPHGLSCLFPYAGWAIMRSDWGRDALYMMMDCGPFGYGHQHEDKLSFVLHAYGSRLVFDAGSYAYDASEMHWYVISARGHNVIHVDGREQHRRGEPRESYVAKAPVKLAWRTTPDYDYVASSYGTLPQENWGPKDWGPEKIHNVVHTRQVLFVKPTYWIVVDTLTPTDDAEHEYASTFHLDAPDAAVDAATGAVSITNAAGVRLAILPLPLPGLETRVITGQMKPYVQGWLPKEHATTGANPRPCVTFALRAPGVTRLLYVLAPAAAGKPLPVTAVQPDQAGDAALAAKIVLAGGGEHRVSLSQAGDLTFVREGRSAPIVLPAPPA